MRRGREVMHGARWGLLILVLAGGACAQSHDRDPSGARATDSTIDRPPAAGAMAAMDDRADSDLTGRWTSSMFEDPLEVELVIAADGTLSGRVCGPAIDGAGDNCGPLTAAWVSGGMIHFDFALPWPGIDAATQYQFIGARGEDDVFRGGLLIDGQLFPITFTRCPAERRWCPASHR